MADVSTDRTPNAQDGEWVNPAYAWYVVFVLTLAYTCSFIDRQVLTLLIEPIRRDLHVTDTQVSLLGGLAFTLFYTTLGMPMARFADQSHRRNLMAVGLGFWTLMTWACGLAKGFWTLFLGRVGVGVGEAALSPAAFSLLSDYFPPQRLARAISVYSTGVYFGGGLALMIGGSVIKMVSSAPMVSLPFLGEIFAWQFTFIVVGAIGLPVLALMFTIREPKRRGLKVVTTDAKVAEKPSGWPALRAFLKINRRTVTCHILAFSCYGIAIGCYQFWAPSFMMRSYGWTPPQAGFTIGALMFVLGTAGVFCGGWVADWLASKGRRDAILRTARAGMACGLPFIILTPLAGDARLATVGLGFAIFFLAFPQGLPAAALQVMTPNPLRAQMSAIYFFIGSLIASGIGPLLPALLTDYVFQQPVMLRYAVSIVGGIAALLSLFILSFGLDAYGQSVQRAEERLG